jgi:hypothetical protein
MNGQQLWQVLAGLPAWQITEMPRPDGMAAGDVGLAQRVQALASAYGAGAPLALAWVRDQPGGPIRVLAAGPALAGAKDMDRVLLTLPAGARGTQLDPSAAAGMLAAVPCWTRISGVADVLLGDDGMADPSQVKVPPSLEDGLLSVWLDGFAWLLLAEPASPHMIEELAIGAARAQLAAQQFSSPGHKLTARRAGARHDELRRAATAGLWKLHLLAGAASADGATRVAQLLCASADLRGLPYALSVQPGAGSLPEALACDGGAAERKQARERARAAQAAYEQDRSWWDTPMGMQPRAPGPGQGQWGQPGSAATREARHVNRDDDTPVPESPFLASTPMVAAVARVPAREVPGVRFTLRPQFDVTPETMRSQGLSVTAGVVLDWNRMPAGTLALPADSLNRHVFVCGATGSGKSQTIRNLLEQATGVGIPWLVVEPAKAEYRLMAARLPDAEVVRIRPGDLDLPAAGINPLEPAPGPEGIRFPLQTHADLLRALFLAAFQADEPFPQVLSAALSRCYEQAGWDLVTGQSATPGVQPAYPGLDDLQSAAMAVVGEIGYGREVADNVRGFVSVRIGSLRLGTAGRFLDGAHPLDFAELLNRNVVLEIEDAGDDHDKAFLMGAVLIRLIEHLRLRHRHEHASAPGLRHLTAIEEAHRLLRQPPPGTATGPAAHSVEMFADILAEIRAYGEGLIIAEQIPSKLIPDVIKNTAVKITHRLPAADDRATVGATMNLTDAQSQYLVTIPPGEAAVHTDGMDFPVLARMPDGTDRETRHPADAASPATVIGRRSISCGQDCRDSPCTLAQMRHAHRVTTADPRIVLWAELTVIAHLTGWTMPRPDAGFGADLRAMPARLRDCSFSSAVDMAVAARVPAFIARVSPGAFARHVATAMREGVATGEWLCEHDEPQYLAPAYQWSVIHDALRLAYRGTSTGRHPQSEEWELRYGLPIPGDTCARQFSTVKRRSERAQQDHDALAIIAWGSRARSAIEQAVGTTRDDEQWNGRFGDSLEAFGSPRWPSNYLRRQALVRQPTGAGK